MFPCMFGLKRRVWVDVVRPWCVLNTTVIWIPHHPPCHTAFPEQTCITRNGRNEICSFSWTPQSGQTCEQHRKNVIICWDLWVFSPSRSAFLIAFTPSFPPVSVCLSLFILCPFCFTFGTCLIFINSLARLPLRPVQRGAGGGRQIGRGVSTGLNPVLGGRYESSGSMNRHAAKISPSSYLWIWGEL